jgi:signal transduction histidine kinase
MNRVAPGQPLAVRLALVLAGAVLVVLLVAGLLINRVVSSSFEAQVATQQQERLDDVASVIGELNRPGARSLIGRLATATGGEVTLIDRSGATVFVAGRLPANAPTERYEASVPTGQWQKVVLEVPGRGGAGFLRSFNLALVVAGIVSVLVLVAAAALLSNRLTRPLRGVAEAANRVGAGDLSARASGGSDRDSRQLADAFNRMAERLERSELLRRRAASDMAHDLATPATVLESQLQAMVDGVVATDRDQLESARASASALSGVIGRLGELIEAESAPLARHTERASVDELLAEARAALDALYRERSVALAVEAEPDLATTVDRAQVGRALRNVLANAAQHARAGSTVRAAARRGATGGIELRVTDAGPGIAAADLPHIFERFYRADPSRRAAGAGSGIGLTIARELLTANGGAISVEATGPTGTTFLVQLPGA